MSALNIEAEIYAITRDVVGVVCEPDIEIIRGYYIAHPDGSRIGQTFVNCGHDVAVAMNFARLFAAAPDLLAALIKAENFISGFEDDELQEGMEELLQHIRDAITDASPL